MEAVITCLAQGHDRKLLIAAGLICIVGIYAASALSGHAGRSDGSARRNWASVSIVAAGCTAWATHMVAVLAYRPGMPAAFDLPLTALSLLAVIAGIGFSMSRMIGRQDRWRRFASGLLLGLSITVLHYLGQYGYRVTGTMSWDLPLVAGSIGTSLLIFGAAMVVAVDRRRAVRRLAPPLLFVAIAVLHVGGMTAMTLSYDPSIGLPDFAVAAEVIAPIVAGVCSALVVLAFFGLRFSLQAQAQLRRDRTRLRELSNLALEGLVVCEGEIVSIVNDSFTRLTGVAAEDVIGRPVTEIIPIDAPFEMTEREEYDMELARACGTPVPVRVLRGEVKVGRKNQTVFAFRDQRERLKSEEIIRAREADLRKAKVAAEEGTRAKSLFLASVSHELRTPLHGIMGTIDLLRDTELGEGQRGYVDTMAQSSDGLLSLVNMLLDFTRLEEGKVTLNNEPFDLAGTVRSVVDLLKPLARAKEIGLDFELDGCPDGQVVGDAGRFRQVLTNILGNAVKFTDAGSVSLRLSWTDGQCRIDVEDTGVGISRDRLAAIFEPFTQENAETTRRFGGTGLGLSISRMLSQQMGGDIRVLSVVGEGSTFSLVLPFPRAVAARALIGSTGPEPLPDLSGFDILVVDDNKVNRFLAERYLASVNARIRQAEDGIEAVASAEENLPDAILMDISMPRMNGLDATREIRLRERGQGRCVIIGLSANAYEEDQKRCLEAGMDGFLAKPVSRAKLIEVLSKALSVDPNSGTDAADTHTRIAARAG
ncbi:signal transduction histidine kinase [Palleronia aestuarii]|uniref:histidine kinase n=1 Tax=Palleronia aestuarii TaxID=568105 RepID=A0A2W7PZD3_9RHOB|nr:ATP-binding protein [Palleronia aestuarii]PZX14889.1 signal transduction histidine kinase [Palleronia aestuarii]